MESQVVVVDVAAAAVVVVVVAAVATEDWSAGQEVVKQASVL